MLSVIGIWSYMFLTTFLAGYGILGLVTRYAPYRVRHFDSYLLCGFAGVTVYAQFFSIFGPVGFLANLLLCMACIIIAWRARQPLAGMLKGMWVSIKTSQLKERGKAFLVLFLFLLFAYGASRGIIHYDTGLYHAQSIRWIEEYGVVKGLGNLHCRLAYNSSSFALSALYSMSFLGGQSFHCAAGWLAFVLAGVCLEVAGPLSELPACITGGAAGRIRIRTSDFARVAGLYYLVIIFDEMVSPASDYFMVLLAFYIVIRFLELLENEVGEIVPYAMLGVLGVFLMTVKLSAALILALVCYPAYKLVRERRWRETVWYLLMGMVTALPFFIRNVLLSGWLVYPFTQIDLFDVTWKIPKGMADYDAKEIQVWGRGYADVSRYDIPMKEWLPDWFRALSGSDKLLTAAAVVSVCVLLVYGAGMLCGLWKKRWGVLIAQGTVAGSFLFWLCTSPLIRYGCVYVYLTPAVVFGGIYDAVVNGREDGQNEDGGAQSRRGFIWSRAASLCCGFGICLLLLYKCAALGGEIVRSYVNDYWLVQKDYENYETLSYEINGITFYYPLKGDQVGYEAFPSAPVKTEVELMGGDIREGFRAVSKERISG